MYRPSAGVICLLCNRSVLRRRRITLTQELFNEHPEAVTIATENLHPYQVCVPYTLIYT